MPISRYDDAPRPHWGGAYIERWDFNHTRFMGSCTSGFAVNASALVYTMLTAAHCGANSYWFTGDASDRYVSGNENPRNDAMLLNQGSSNGNVGAIWVGGSLMGERPQGGARVARAQTSRVGDFICTSGAFSGSFCNMRVQSTRQAIDMGGFGTVTEAILAIQRDGLGAVGNGDSGGPVFSVDEDGRVAARGTLSAIPSDQGTWVDCQGVPGGPPNDPNSRHCSWAFWYPDILFQMGGMSRGVTIRTLP